MYYTQLLDYCGDWSFVTFAACKEELRIGDGGGCVGAPERPLKAFRCLVHVQSTRSEYHSDFEGREALPPPI